MLRKELLVETLIKIGLPEDVLNEFDTHSTIMLSTNKEINVSVYISEEQEHVWIWAKLNFLSDYAVQNNIYDLFTLLLEPKDFVLVGQYTLGKSSISGFELKALIKYETLASADALAYAILNFCEDLNRIYQITN